MRICSNCSVEPISEAYKELELCDECGEILSDSYNSMQELDFNYEPTIDRYRIKEITAEDIRDEPPANGDRSRGQEINNGIFE